MNELIKLDFTLDPTFNIYEASRDLHRARRAEWHEDYTLPSLWKFYEPSKVSHGSYWHYWGTEQEVQWKNNYKLWMTFINEFKQYLTTDVKIKIAKFKNNAGIIGAAMYARKKLNE